MGNSEMIPSDRQLNTLLRAIAPDDGPPPAPSQFGYIVEDLAAAQSRVAATLGITRWYEIRARRASMTWRGAAFEPKLRIVVGYHKGIQIELIHLGNAENGVYGESATGQDDGFHHLCFFVRDLDAAAERFERAGFELCQSGEFAFAPRSKTRVAYFDTRAANGLFLELLENRVRGRYVGIPEWLLRIGTLFGHVGRVETVQSGKEASPGLPEFEETVPARACSNSAARNR